MTRVLTREQQLRRDGFLGVGTYDGGIAPFRYATHDALQRLLDEGLVNACDKQKPTYREIVAWLREHKRFVAHGSVVTPERADCRVSLKGVEAAGSFTLAEHADFARMFGDADDFQMNETRCFCWYAD